MPDYFDPMEPEKEAWTGPASGEIRELFRELRSQASTRNAEYQDARAAYDGDHYEGLGMARPLNRYSLTANYMRPLADKDVQIMMGQLPGLQVLPPSADAAGREMAERIEGLLYGNWEFNKAHEVFLAAAWNCVVLRRGVIHYWWDAEASHVRFRSISPDNFYPVYDGEDVYECIYVSRRLTRSLKKAYPEYADDITSDGGMDLRHAGTHAVSQTSGGITEALQYAGSDDGDQEAMTGYTTVYDYYDREGAWVRLMGGAEHRQNLGYPEKGVPIIQIDNSVHGDEQEPQNGLDHLIELNQYYDQLLSAKGDIIKKYANPPIVDQGSGIAPAKIHQIMQGDGGVLPIRERGTLSTFKWEGNVPDIEGQMQEVKELLYDLSGKPRSAFGQTITNQSGVATNLALTPTLQSNELRQTVWASAFVDLNRAILQLYEEFSKAKAISFHTVRRRFAGAATVMSPIAVEIGAEIAGWYKTAIKWPSSIRVDDPVYVDTELKKLGPQGGPQAQSLYDTMENLGFQDVEAAIDRIRAEREDPRIHPEVLANAITAAQQIAGQGGIGQDLAAGTVAGGAPAPGYGEPPPDLGVTPSTSGQAAMSAGMPQVPAGAL